MIRYFFRKVAPISLALLALVSLVPSQIASAAGNTIYLTPSSQGLNPGGSVTVQINGNLATGSFIGADQFDGTLRFPANLLKVTGVSTAGATFNWQASATPNNSNGTVVFSESSFFPIDNTSVFIGAVTFQALTAGAANVSWSGTNYSYSGSAYPTTATGGAYAITNPTCPTGQVGTPPNCTTPPPPTCPTGQVGTPPNCTTPTCPSGQTGTPPNCTTPGCPTGQTGTPPNCKTPPITTPTPTLTPSTPTPVTSGTANSSPQPDTTTPSAPIPAPETNGLTISEATITRHYSSAELTWKTSAAATNTIEFGADIKTLDQKADVVPQPDGTYSSLMTGLVPGKRYYFTISSVTTADATKTGTYSGVFTTRGFPVGVTITEGGSAAANATLTLSNQSYRTNAEGKLTMELAAGSYSSTIKTAHGSKSVTLVVAAKPVPDDGNPPATQSFSFDVPATTQAASSGGLSLLTMLGIGLGVLGTLFLLFLLVLFLRRRKNDQGENTVTVAGGSDYDWAQQQPLPTMPEVSAAYPQMDQPMTPPVSEQMVAPEVQGYQTYDQQAPELMAAQNIGYAQPPVAEPLPEQQYQAVPEPPAEYAEAPLSNMTDATATVVPMQDDAMTAAPVVDESALQPQEPVQEETPEEYQQVQAVEPEAEIPETEEVAQPEVQPVEVTSETQGEAPAMVEEAETPTPAPVEDDATVVVDQAKGEITIEHHR